MVSDFVSSLEGAQRQCGAQGMLWLAGCRAGEEQSGTASERTVAVDSMRASCH
jgi:hypothetical protein